MHNNLGVVGIINPPDKFSAVELSVLGLQILLDLLGVGLAINYPHCLHTRLNVLQEHPHKNEQQHQVQQRQG